MSTISTGILVLVGAFFLLMMGMQVLVRAQARALTGKPVPALPGPLGARVAGSGRALVYFFSPMCGACRAITPRIQALGKKSSAVFAVDVSQTDSLDVARALRIMATPSTVEIDDGKIRGVYIGPVPDDVMERFS